MTCFPCTVNLEFLVELVMDFSKLEKLWEGIIVSYFDLSFFQIYNLYIFSYKKLILPHPFAFYF